MHQLFTSGRVVDLIIGLMILEALALGAYYRLSGRGIGIAHLAANLAAGLCLLLALRAALTGQAWVWVALALAMSLLAHLLDLSLRWPRPRRQQVSLQPMSAPFGKKL